jgi:anaerobic ribonucleoside-triphosphate reductase activating protein
MKPAGSKQRTNLRVAAFLPRSLANGPGARSVLWVQGCNLRCPGCFNPGFLPLEGGGAEHAPDEVAGWMLDVPGTEGVSFSGGEPFLQSAALAKVARSVRAAGKSVIIFSGQDWETLRGSRDQSWQALLAETDAIIAGPYRRELPSRQPLLGSANQRIICLTDRYREEDFTTVGPGHRMEFRIAPGGAVTVTGFPSQALISLLVRSLKS